MRSSTASAAVNSFASGFFYGLLSDQGIPTALEQITLTSCVASSSEHGYLRRNLKTAGLRSGAASQPTDAWQRGTTIGRPRQQGGPNMLDQLRRDIQTHLSRWIAGVLRNEPLAADIAGAEAGLSADSPTETVEDARHALVTALQARHVRWR